MKEVDFKWYEGYSDPFGVFGKKKAPQRYVCALTEDGYKYLDFLREFNETAQSDDRLCTTRRTEIFSPIYKWVPDKNNYVEQQINQFKRENAEEIEEALKNLKKPKTPKQIKAAYKRKLRQTIIKSIKEAQNGLHRPQQG